MATITVYQGGGSSNPQASFSEDATFTGKRCLSASTRATIHKIADTDVNLCGLVMTDKRLHESSRERLLSI